MDNEECQCFTCANRDNPLAVKSYLIGQLEAYKNVANKLQKSGVSLEPMKERSPLVSLLLECNYNIDACTTFLSEFKDIELKGRTVENLKEEKE